MQMMKNWKMTIPRGNIYKYLRMTINYSSTGEVKFSTVDYIIRTIDNILEYMKGESEKPDGQHLLDTAEYVTTLSQTNIYPLYNLVAQLLYLSTQAQPDI